MTIDPNTAPTELLPCPFCGSTDIATDGPSYTLFMCNGCGGQTYDQDSHAEALAAWNRRTPAAMQPDGLVERYASRSDELAEGGEYPWWSGLAELLRSQSAHITSLQARLDAAVEALKPWASIADVVLAEAPPVAEELTVFTDCDGCKHVVTLDAFRAARSIIGQEAHSND